MILRWLRSALVLGVLLGAPQRSFAQKHEPPVAEALFREGKAAMASGDYERACAKFRASEDIESAPGTLFNLAECEEKRGRIATAWTTFGQVLQRLPTNDERRSTVAARIDDLAPKVPRLTVRLARGAPAGTTVTRSDGASGVLELGTSLPVDPGKLTLRVVSDGRAPRSFEVELREADRKEIEVEPGAAPGAGASSSAPAGAATPPISDGAAPDGRRTAGWVVGGIGAASLGVGVVTGILVLGKKSTVENNCPDQRCHSQADLDAADSGKTLSLVSTITFAVGVAGIGAGALLVLTSGKRPRSSRAVVVPVASANGGALVASGRF